ncbi:hypothetical protein P8605_00810 [Streptomyces sp. T-3]|nr:hypothetical protein [Streptomyces sp. T-3]
MARIRTIKPEAFASESLAAVSIAAERTFFGLLTQADDRGRFRDQPAVIAGLLWSLRPEHGPLDVEEDLSQLAGAGLICRYPGADGKRYLHLVTFGVHQKINRPSGSRNPGCPVHDHGGVVVTVDNFPHGSARGHGAIDDASRHAPRGGEETSASPRGELREPSTSTDEPAGQSPLSEPSPSGRGGLRDTASSPHRPDLGPRTMDLGSTPLGGAGAHPPETISAGQLIGEYVAAYEHRPPRGFLEHLGREINKLLGEGIDIAHLRAGLKLHRTKGLSPSTLPSVVHEAMNATSKINRGSGGTVLVPSPHTPWRNPADPAAYEEEL